MTREEAIAKIKILKEDYWEDDGYGHETDDCQNTILALDMAITELEKEPCGDAISRQAVLEAIDAKAWEFCDYLISKGRNDEQKPVSHFADNLRECISKDLPPVTPAEKVGQWKSIRYWYECDKCGESNLENTNYCPSCGAKMQEGKE